MQQLIFNILFSILLLSSLGLVAQNGCFEIEWEQNYGGSDRDWGNSIIQTNDGGYAMAGYSRSNDIDVGSNNGDWDFWIIKVDAAGNLQWERNYGGSLNDEATAIQQTIDGGYVVTGATFSSDGDVSNNNGQEDFWVIKLDESGNMEWERTYGGSEVDRAEAIVQLDDEGFMVAGFSASQDGDLTDNYGNFDYWLIRLTDNGDILWQRNYGGSESDWAYELIRTQDGGFLMVGSTISDNGDIIDNHGIYDFWVVKTGFNGNIEWTSNYGGTEADRAYYVQQDQAGNFYICGSSNSNNTDVNGNNGSFDFWIIKTDPTGNIIWNKNLGGQGAEWAWALDLTEDNGVVVTGRSNTSNLSGDVSGNYGSNDFWLTKLSADGNIEWEDNYGGSDQDVPYGIHQTIDEGYVIAGYSTSDDVDVNNNHGDWDYWILKIKPREVELDLGNDTLLCPGATLLLDAFIEPGNTFEWQDGSNESTFLVEEEGVFFVDAQTGDCDFTDTIEVQYLDSETLDLGPDTAFCADINEPYLINASVLNAISYNWQNGSTDSVLLAQQSGTYWVEVNIAGCATTDTINIALQNPEIDLGQDTFKCEFEPLTLNAFYPDATYLWSDGSTDRKLILGDTGTYWVAVNLEGCISFDTIHVGLCDNIADPCLLFPNAFTPNGDGVNDEFKPRSYCRLDSYDFTIYTRYGQPVFQTNDIEQGWNGFSNNKKPISGVYVYVANITFQQDGILKKETFRGFATLVQ